MSSRVDIYPTHANAPSPRTGKSVKEKTLFCFVWVSRDAVDGADQNTPILLIIENVTSFSDKIPKSKKYILASASQ